MKMEYKSLVYLQAPKVSGPVSRIEFKLTLSGGKVS